MSDADQSERERIREQKRRRLRERLTDEDAEESTGGAGEADTGDETPSEPVAVGDPEAFQRLVGEHDVVLVDCYADWCGPCQMLEPVVEGVAEETSATVAKVDVDANQQLASAYDVRGVPTLVLFADGTQVEEVVGVQSEDQLRSLVASYT